jgi:alkanesulfonate monooxygenase SsuD/methylene tetrahydromethanopterin reductase-like flavin-dependent oxidoreductase (luciferase family)
MAPKKQLILNAFVESCSGHQSPGLWAHPEDQSANFNDVKHWVKLAQLLEAANFHGIFIADVLVCPCLNIGSSRHAIANSCVLSLRVLMTSTKGLRTPTRPSFRARNGL